MADELLQISGNDGISKSKLEKCTATEADVLSGKTFYAGSTDLKTGTGKVAVLVGTFGEHHDSYIRSATFDMTKILPNDYKKLETTNFLVCNPSLFADRGSSSVYDTFGFRLSYSAETGIITINCQGIYIYSATVYCIL